jgi:hypothetical protein
MTDSIRIRLFSKIAIYYGTCLALTIYAGLAHPEWMKYLPFGGLDVLQNDAAVIEDGDLLDQLLVSQRPLAIFDDAMNLISALAGCLIVMIPLRWLYMTDGLKKSWNKDVATSLLVLPLIVTAIVYIVKFSLPLAFALAGIFAGVRYRTSLKSQSDAFFTFACIAVGLSAGTRSLGIALVMAMFFAFTVLAVPPRHGESNIE